MTHPDLPGSPENRSVTSTSGGNRYASVAGYPPAPRHATRCPTCGAWWTGINTAHCGGKSGCHRTFTTVAAFDKHRTGSHERDTRHCLDPATIVHGPRSKHAGEPMLVDAGRDYPCWGFASTGEWWGGDVA